MKTVIVSAPTHPWLLAYLQKDHNVLYVPDISYEQLLVEIEHAEGLVVTTRISIDAAMIAKAGKLQWIGRLGSGMELIDLKAAAEKGVHCVSTPEGNSNAVAEHTLALLLNLYNHITRSFLQIREGQWLRSENRGTELRGKVVGIIGFGNTGSSFARLLQPFEVEVLAYDKYRKGYAKDYIRESTLEEIFSRAEVVSMHLPLTEETKFMANRDFFEGLKQRPLFLSTCRGKVTHTASLITALKEGWISAAGLDVLENEKLSSFTNEQKEQLAFLTSQPNVVLTPHIAGYSAESYQRMAEVLIGKLRSLNLLF